MTRRPRRDRVRRAAVHRPWGGRLLLALLGVAVIAGAGLATRRGGSRTAVAPARGGPTGAPEVAGAPLAAPAVGSTRVELPADEQAPARAEPARAEPARGEPARGEPAREEPAREEPAREEPAPRNARAARRARTRLVVLLLTAAVAVAGLLYGADRMARIAAETVLADELQRVTGVFEVPEVQVHGASFLLQAVRGRYDRVDITLTSLASGPLRVERVQAELSDVYVPLNAVLLQDADRIVIGHAEELAVLEYPDLNRYLQFTGRPFEVQPAGDDRVTITGEVRVLGEDYRPQVDARLGARDGSLAVSPTRLDTGTELDRAAELLLGERFTFLVPLDPLPFGQQVTGIEALLGGIFVTAEGDDVVVPTD